ILRCVLNECTIGGAVVDAVAGRRGAGRGQGRMRRPQLHLLLSSPGLPPGRARLPQGGGACPGAGLPRCDGGEPVLLGIIRGTPGRLSTRFPGPVAGACGAAGGNGADFGAGAAPHIGTVSEEAWWASWLYPSSGSAGTW